MIILEPGTKCGDKNIALFKALINKNGPEHQVKVAIGEIGEFLTLYGRSGSGRDTLEEWVDEIADLLITANQMAVLAGIPSVLTRINHKLGKLEKRLESGEFDDEKPALAIVTRYKEQEDGVD